MKHTITITIFLVVFFILGQSLGLFLIAKDAEVNKEIVGNQTVIVVQHGDTSIGPRPETTGAGSFLYLASSVIIGTILVLLLIRFKKINIWRVWFFLAVWIALSIAFGVLIKKSIFFEYDIAIFIALLLALWKIFKPNFMIYNITELLMYAGIAVLLVPMFNVVWVVILLIIVSGYDMYAVWKSKHMIKMVKFQTKSKVFAGLVVPYNLKKEKARDVKIESKGLKTRHAKVAILGGGDITFPLIFSGTILEWLIKEGLTKQQAFLEASIITFTAAAALTMLFVFAKKGRFYPAMPFITIGCLVGYLIVLLIG